MRLPVVEIPPTPPLISVQRRMYRAPIALTALLLLGVPTFGADPPPPRQMAGGSPATATEFPSAVSVSWLSRSCLGTLLTSKWILTAAHCVDGASFLTVNHVSGENVYSFVNVDGRADDRRWGVLFHPDYDPLAGEASTKDIALIEMDEPLTSRYVRPVTLPSPTHVAQFQNGLNVTVLGVDSSTYPAQLAQATWPLVECDSPNDWTVCVQMTVSQHIELGDSGGPVLMRDGDDWILVGTTFYSYGAGGKLVAQRTSYYLPWIAQYVEGTPAPVAPPVTTPTPGVSTGVTVTLRNRTASRCRIDDLLTTAGAVGASPGGSAEVRIDGQNFRTVLLVECGQP